MRVRKWVGRGAADLIYGLGKSFCCSSLKCLPSSHRGTEIVIHPHDEMPGMPSRPKTSHKLCLLLRLF